MDEPTEAVIAATALVDKWAKEYRAYLKDGGGNRHAVHPAAHAALVDHVARAFEARAAKPALKLVPTVAKAAVGLEDAVLVNAVETDDAPKAKRARKSKAQAE